MVACSPVFSSKVAAVVVVVVNVGIPVFHALYAATARAYLDPVVWEWLEVGRCLRIFPRFQKRQLFVAC